ncbi:MAG TPA: hypothetical protein VKS24_20350 [Bradyrhizobium sp.]|nr:hypothetical protein [Bradyrhizobium sp.]
MSLTLAAALATALNFGIFTLIAVWYVAPWLQSQQRTTALSALIWVHVFRDIALQIFSAQKFGFAVSDPTRDMIALGDVTGALLALISLLALRYRPRMAPFLVWLLILETVADLLYGTVAGSQEQIFEKASGVTFMILASYVPLLWVSLALTTWQLLSRRSEAPPVFAPSS